MTSLMHPARIESDPSFQRLMRLLRRCQSSREHYWSLSMHSCKSLIACDNVFSLAYLITQAHARCTTAISGTHAFIDSSSIDDNRVCWR